jgi:hypothetical protein
VGVLKRLGSGWRSRVALLVTIVCGALAVVCVATAAAPSRIVLNQGKGLVASLFAGNRVGCIDYAINFSAGTGRQTLTFISPDGQVHMAGPTGRLGSTGAAIGLFNECDQSEGVLFCSESSPPASVVIDRKLASASIRATWACENLDTAEQCAMSVSVDFVGVGETDRIREHLRFSFKEDGFLFDFLELGETRVATVTNADFAGCGIHSTLGDVVQATGDAIDPHLGNLVDRFVTIEPTPT